MEVINFYWISSSVCQADISREVAELNIATGHAMQIYELN